MSFKERVLQKLVKETSPIADGPNLYTSTVLRGKNRGKQFTIDHPSLRYVFGYYEPETTREMERFVHKGDVVYDVGAHAGYLSMYMSKLVGKRGKVFSFEPSPQNRKLLQKNVLDNSIANVRITPYAVTNTKGEVKFVLSSPSYGSHIAHEDEKEQTSLSVQSTTVDEFIASGEGEPPSFIKIDVEGQELAVLQGAVNTLATYHPVVVAEIRQDYWDNVLHIMESRGYTWRILSKRGNLNYKMGTPNILFIPALMI